MSFAVRVSNAFSISGFKIITNRSPVRRKFGTYFAISVKTSNNLILCCLAWELVFRIASKFGMSSYAVAESAHGIETFGYSSGLKLPASYSGIIDLSAIYGMQF